MPESAAPRPDDSPERTEAVSTATSSGTIAAQPTGTTSSPGALDSATPATPATSSPEATASASSPAEVDPDSAPTAGQHPGAPPNTAAATRPTTAGQGATALLAPLGPMPPPPPVRPVVQRWQRVARPAGVLPAAAVAGAVGATVIPLDRPGIGWLLAGITTAGALYAVDHHARSRATTTLDSTSSSPTVADIGAAPTHHAPGASAEPSVPNEPNRAVAASSLTATDGVTSPARSGPADAVPAAPEESSGPATRADGKPVPGMRKSPDALAPTAGAGCSPAVSESSGSATQPKAGASAEVSSPDESAARATGTGTEPVPSGHGSPGAPAREPDAPSAGSPAARVTGMAPRVSVDKTEPSGPGGSIGRTTDGRGGGAPTAWDRVWWAGAALMLLGVGTFRAAGWLFVLCVLSAGVAGSLAVLGRRSGRGLAHDVVAVPLATFGAVPWAFDGVRQGRSAQVSRMRRYGVSVAVTAGLLVVFVPLLGGADATFAELLSGLVPRMDAAVAWQWLLMFAVLGTGALGALYLLAGPPAPAAESARPRRLWARSEWVLPVAALTVLFAVFLGAQAVALFGGDDYVQRTAGLTYAEYARSGFWQLSAVSILTLGVILAVLHWSAQDSAADRRWLRVLLSAVSVLALVIVCSALGRMWTYQQAYGFTVLRVLVTMCELWVGLVYVLVVIAVARLRWRWVPRAALGTALATLIGLSILNPELFVADRNIDRWEHGKRLDTAYLRTLSPDILPALQRLPDPMRTDIETRIVDRVDDDSWWSWNLSRDAAR